MFNFFKKRRQENRRKQRVQYKLNVKVRSSHRTEAQFDSALRWLAASIFIGLILFGVVRAFQTGVAHWFTENPSYNIAGIDVETDGSMKHERIIELAGVREGQNLYSTDLLGIRNSLETHPAIRKAEVYRLMPNKLKIVISERVPVAQFFTRGQYDVTRRLVTPPRGYLIDVEGVAMNDVNTFAQTKTKFPVLVNVDVKEVKLGRKLDLEEVMHGLDLIHLCEAPDVATLLDYERIDLGTKNCLVMVTRQGGSITFAMDDLQGQLKRLKAILTRSTGQVIQSCDLSVGMNVPVRYFPAATSSAGTATSVANVNRSASGGKYQ